jgi:hypothetical protein
VSDRGINLGVELIVAKSNITTIDARMTRLQALCAELEKRRAHEKKKVDVVELLIKALAEGGGE